MPDPADLAPSSRDVVRTTLQAMLVTGSLRFLRRRTHLTRAMHLLRAGGMGGGEARRVRRGLVAAHKRLASGGETGKKEIELAVDLILGTARR